jgi:hypothetical protein
VIRKDPVAVLGPDCLQNTSPSWPCIWRIINPIRILRTFRSSLVHLAVGSLRAIGDDQSRGCDIPAGRAPGVLATMGRTPESYTNCLGVGSRTPRRINVGPGIGCSHSSGRTGQTWRFLSRLEERLGKSREEVRREIEELWMDAKPATGQLLRPASGSALKDYPALCFCRVYIAPSSPTPSQIDIAPDRISLRRRHRERGLVGGAATDTAWATQRFSRRLGEDRQQYLSISVAAGQHRRHVLG